METKLAEKKYRYEEISEYLSEAVKTGVLPWGQKIPSLRKMSAQFNCSVSVVMQAYEELERQGLISSVEKSGFFVCNLQKGPLPDPQREEFLLKSEEPVPLSIIGRIVEVSNEKSILPLGAGIPDESLLPIAGLRHSMARVCKESPSLFQEYTGEAGSLNLRIEIARIMLKKGIVVKPSEIVLTNGCTEALFLVVTAVSRPGDTVAMESPAFPGIIRILNELGRKVIPIPTSVEKGMDLDVLETVLKKGQVKAVIMTAIFQNPLGFVMSEASRQRAVSMVEKYNIPIIEDDIYSDCSYKGEILRPLKSFDQKDSVIYCSSFSKVISPSLRIGWIIGGAAHCEIKKLKMTFSLGGSALLQEGLTDFLKSTRYNHHISQFQRKISRQSMEMSHLLQTILPTGTAITHPDGGFYLWLEFSENLDTMLLFENALKEGISLVPGQAFSSAGRYRNCLRISCGAPVCQATREGILRLAELLKVCYFY